MRILYVLHADFELPGIIASWASQKEFQQRFSRPFTGENLPALTEFDLLIVIRGPQSPLNLIDAPYLAQEIDLIREALKANIPVLGFCLGAQLIGEALGGTTERSPHKEVGVFPVKLTDEGLKDPLLEGLPQQFPVMHWHNDMPGLTKDAQVLGSSEGCPRQIVRYSFRAYGFQCHPEMTKENVIGMLKHCSEDLTGGPYVQTAEQLLNQDFQAINQNMVRILNNFLQVQELTAY